MFLFYKLSIAIIRHYNQGTPPFMALEALLAERNDEFAHLPCHDLESILYVILFICTFTKGPNLPQLDFETPDTVSMRAWFATDTIKAIGCRKLADMCRPERTIIPEFTEYWRDFGPFVLELLQLCFPYKYNPAYPNHLTHEGMLSILERASGAVREPPTNNCMPVGREVRNLKRTKQSGHPTTVPTKRIR